MNTPSAASPDNGRDALRVFARHASPRLIVLAAAAALAVRLWLGNFGWIDPVVVLAVWAAFPVNEWLIHVVMLHYRPRRVLGRMVDFYLPKTHRWHHAEPWKLEWVFIPRHVHMMVFPLAALIVLAAGSFRSPVLTGIAAYLCLGLHYEWVHYLAHIRWCPRNAYYQRRVREHRWHHFLNENYWWGVSMGLGDRLFGTASSPEAAGRTGSAGAIAPAIRDER